MAEFLVRHTPWHLYHKRLSSILASIVLSTSFFVFIFYYLGLWAVMDAIESSLTYIPYWVALAFVAALIGLPPFVFGAFCPSPLCLFLPVVGDVIGSLIWWSSPWANFASLTYDGWGPIVMIMVIVPLTLVLLPAAIGRSLGWTSSHSLRGL